MDDNFAMESGHHRKPKRSRDDRDYRGRRSRSRDRSRDRGRGRRSWSSSRSRSRERERDRAPSRRTPERDLYKDLINEDYQEERDRGYYRNDHRSRDKERDRRDRDNRSSYNKRNYSPDEYSMDSHDSDTGEFYYNQTPNNKIIVRGLAQHITEADISGDLLQCGLKPLSIRLIRRKKTGASRGFAFVEFSTEEEATRWMEYKQGVLMVQDQYRAIMQYSISKDPPQMPKDKFMTDWYCAKCGVFNFKRRDNCFKCHASREESEKGGEGSDEVSQILTKKIMLRNLDVLTNEEGVLTLMQEVVPSLVAKISKILICRDPLTSTSRGICYLTFDNLVDSMNTHNALNSLDPPLQVDSREVLISYCMDSDNRPLRRSSPQQSTYTREQSPVSDHQSANAFTAAGAYTLADVPRLAEYSASIYASNKNEHDHYLKYYTDYYVLQISKGHFSNLPAMNQISETANSGAAVAHSAIQRKQTAQHKQKLPEKPSVTAVPVAGVRTPKGDDGRRYPTPDVSTYQYDETSGFYYDPSTGLYYDASSQYYYNNDINTYMYWDNDQRTYIAVQNEPSSTVGPSSVVDHPQSLSEQNEFGPQKHLEQSSAAKEPRKDQKQDKVKVAKKIVKDMEKWAKQLNQKKEMTTMASMPLMKTSEDNGKATSGYADVGFSILEKKDKGPNKFPIEIESQPANASTSAVASSGRIVAAYGSDSDYEQEDAMNENNGPISEKDYVDFDKLSCLLCKRAFQSNDILNKHLKMSNLHMENLQKYSLAKSMNTGPNSQSYRDRAKERRLKYGEADPPPPNRSKERFQKEMEKQVASIQAQSHTASVPIGQNNVGNRLLQKMGWSEGQGLGRSNQGRTNIIEAESRSATAGLGSNKMAHFGPGDDYKTYIKKMMKSRYEQADTK